MRRPTDAPLYAEMLSRLAGVPLAERPPLLDLVSYLPDDILAKVDRASMAVALEVRAPLLDHRVAEFAIGLPLAMKRRGGTTKWLLRRLLDKRVPRHLIDRPKMGFGVPLNDWFRGPLRERMNDYCAGDDLEELGLDPAPIRTTLARVLGRSSSSAGSAVAGLRADCVVAPLRRGARRMLTSSLKPRSRREPLYS